MVGNLTYRGRCLPCREAIFIPIVDSPPTIVSLPDEQALMALGGELIVVRDRWGNACRTRNIGAAVARGSVLCFIDDDTEFRELLEYIKECLKGEGLFYWSDAPHIYSDSETGGFLQGCGL